MAKKTKVIRIGTDSLDVLDIIARKSGVPRNELINGWTAQLKDVLKDLGDFQALTVLSYRALNKDGKKSESVSTRLGAVFLNSEEWIERDLDSDISPEILASNRALEKKEKLKLIRVKFTALKVNGKVKRKKDVKQ